MWIVSYSLKLSSIYFLDIILLFPLFIHSFIYLFPQITKSTIIQFPFFIFPMGSYVLQNFTHFELIEPDITGTHNLPKECERAKVKKVVVLSSAGAVTLNPSSQLA